MDNSSNSPYIFDSIELGIEYWEDEIQLPNNQLSSRHGNINDEDRDKIEDEPKNAKMNLEDAKKHRN